MTRSEAQLEDVGNARHVNIQLVRHLQIQKQKVVLRKINLRHTAPHPHTLSENPGIKGSMRETNSKTSSAAYVTMVEVRSRCPSLNDTQGLAFCKYALPKPEMVMAVFRPPRSSKAVMAALYTSRLLFTCQQSKRKEKDKLIATKRAKQGENHPIPPPPSPSPAPSQAT